jgi:hypothetical protein
VTTLPEKLKKLNYRGVFTGRWEHGLATQAHLPLQRGIDRFLGEFPLHCHIVEIDSD